LIQINLISEEEANLIQSKAPSNKVDN